MPLRGARRTLCQRAAAGAGIDLPDSKNSLVPAPVSEPHNFWITLVIHLIVMDNYEPIPPNRPQGLREDWTFARRLDGKGQPVDDLEHRREVTLSEGGAIVEKVWAKEREYGCGHDARRSRGGRCGEEGCFRDSCDECYARCSRCMVGLCLFHARSFQTELGPITVCSHCQGALRRSRFWRRFWAALVSPFVTFDKSINLRES